MSRVFGCPLLLALMLAPAWSLQSQSQTAQQQSQTAEQQSQTALQQSQTAQQQSQTAQQQSQTAQQQAQTAQEQAKQRAELAKQQSDGTEQVDMAEVKRKDAERLRDSREVMKSALNEKSGISKALTDKAKCVVVIPSVKKVAFGFGVDYGKGVMTCRLGENFDGPWSAPSMTALEGGNFGLQLGVQATDLVLLVLNERGVNSLLRSKSKLGGDVSVAAGPIGRQMTAATDLGMRAQILSYSHTGGVFAGIALNGSSLRPDNRGNEGLYGRELTAREIVRSGQVPVPADARPLIQTLEQAGTVAATPTAQDK
jgi:SH3 domain-containing YSC84-like protein 1